MPDTYQDFRELREAEREGVDWARVHEDRESRILIMAPHGGWIEPLTTEVARAMAGREFSFYTFMGLKEEGNQALHLTSHLFDEPLALDAASKADRVVAIHGERSRHGAFVMVGGRWDELGAALARVLEREGFPVREPREGLGGRHRRNICNRGRLGAGGQLEISEGLRAQFRQDAGRQTAFVRAVREVLLPFEEGLRGKGAGGDGGWPGKGADPSGGPRSGRIEP